MLPLSIGRLIRSAAKAYARQAMEKAIRSAVRRRMRTSIAEGVAGSFRKTRIRVSCVTTFDRDIIRRNWNDINNGPLKRAGLLVRKVARGSIRDASKAKKIKPSMPGRPPKSRAPGRPFKMIYSVPDGTSVIVGMVGFGGGSDPTPGLHEHGGTVPRMVFPKKGGRREFIRGSNGKRKRVLVRQQVDYPERPFMFPALEQVAPMLPSLWANSV